MGTVAIEEVTGRIAENLECLKRFTATPGDGCTSCLLYTSRCV